MAYTAHDWATGEAITRERMNIIEQGIADAHNSVTDVSGIKTRLNKIDGGTAFTDSSNRTLATVARAAESAASTAQSTADQALSATLTGEKAWNQIIRVTGVDENTGELSISLKTVLDNLDNNTIAADAKAQNALDSIYNAYRVNTVVRDNHDVKAESLMEKITDMDSKILTASQIASTAYSTINQTNVNSQTMKDRLDALDKNQKLSQLGNDANVPDMYSKLTAFAHEVEVARGTNNSGVSYQTLKGRLDKIDGGRSTIRDMHSIIAELTAAHRDLLDTNNNPIDDSLSQRFNNIDNNSVPSRTLPDVITEINNAHRIGLVDANNNPVDDTLVKRFNSIDSNIGTINTNLGYTNLSAASTVKDKVDAAISAAQTTLETHISTLEDNVNGAKVENGPQTLDARFDAVEGIATQLRTDVNTIASELAMVDTDVIVSNNTRIDTIDADLNTTTTGIKDRLTAVENTANAAAVASTVNTALNDLDARLDAIDGGETLAGASTLAARVSANETAITNLQNEPKSATVIIEPDCITYTNDVPAAIYEDNTKVTQITPTEDKDYLLGKTENNITKYYYWKYIGIAPNGNWELISGGRGGEGTSSAEFYTALTDVEAGTESENIDYFIGTDSNYLHYRWRNNAWVQILPDGLIDRVSVDISPVSNGITKSKPVIKKMGSETNLLADFTAIKSISSAVEESGGTTLTWVNIDGEVGSVTITGGGGSSTSITATIDRITDSNITTIAGESCPISYIYTAQEANGDTYETTGQGAWYINGVRVATQDVINGNNTFDLGPYLYAGTNNISLSVTISVDGQNVTRTKTWVINVVNFSLIWEYNESTINSGNTIVFSCTPYGTDITKTLHLKVGVYEQTQTITTSGIPVAVTLDNNFAHGSYTAEMWMTATINGNPETSNRVSHDFIVVKPGNNTPIIAATLPQNEMDQYNTISIPFIVYTPNTTLSTVTLSANGIVQDVRTDVNRAIQTWNYIPSTLGTNIIYDENDPPQPISGTHTLTITSGSSTKTLTLSVKSVKINNAEIEGYVFKLKASELPSNNALQNWYYDDNNINNTKLQFSNNFDWINGGIKTELDENGQLRQYIRVKSGTTMSIPYKMFSDTLQDPRKYGCNFKIIFKVENCRNYDATIATNVANNIGIQLNAHNAIFKSTTTQVSTQYGENDYTELEFEIYKNHTDNDEEANNPYMMAWIDGVITSARPYDGNFTQTDASNIVIGSNDCDVCIYLVKYYPTVLSIANHISNFIADAPNAVEMIKRFNRNDILYQDSTDIDPNKLAQKNRDCRVWLYEIPRMTTGKKDYVRKVGFQQIYQNGTTYQNGLHGIGTLTVQGTSSVNYRKGAANTDINFYDTDAEPISGETFADYSQLYDGDGNNLLYDIVNGEQVLKPVMERGYKINDNSTPITYSNMKVNFASCEQVNNMCNAEWYQQFQPYPSLSTRDCMEFAMGVQFIKDHGQGEPPDEVILFNEKGANRDPNKFYMYSIGNLGTSKKNTHIFHSDNECCVEIMNNQNAGCRMISVPADLEADYTAYQNEDYENMTNYDWGGKNEAKDHSYEMRFPDTKNPAKEIKAGWARFVKWMVENNPSAATNAAIPAETYTPYTFKGHKREGTQVLQGTTVYQYAGEYTTDSFERRMAKMLSECEDYMAMDSIIYHFLFIERHTMVDNVAKNTFWSAAKTNQYINGVEQADTEGYWIWDLSKNYDNDTSDGNNNEGQLIFDYGNEAADRQDGKAVFNASDAVWFIFASNLYEACATMFQNRESATSKNGKWQNAWNATTYHNYLLTEQRKVPERVWNECYWYDYLRTYETGKVYNEETDKDKQIIDKSWITYLDGGQKIHQRKHYETFEELYDASKYRSNFSTSNSITLRGYTPDPDDPSLEAVPAKSEITVKMYNKCYMTVHFDNNLETQKAEKGQYVTLKYLESNGEYGTLSDTVINLDTASMIQEISDLAPLYPGQASFSKAIRLRSIKIGDSTVGYNNPHITNTETGTVDFGANYMLEHLEVQNLSNANQPLNLTGCPALTYLDARGSSFTSIVFANGGLLSEAYINNPTNLIMRNLDLLTLNNFHLTDPTAVAQLRLEGCKLFDKQTFVNNLTNLNIIRLSGINWTLDNNVLLNKLLGIMGMDELGYTVAQSYLAGTITLTGTVYGGDHSEYLKAWSPDLTIDVSHATYIAQHLVTYCDENGVELYTKYTNHNSPLIDIVATEEYSAPTKPADIESQYIFGRLSAGDYLEYSGWRAADASQSFYPEGATGPSIPTITGPISVYAVYTAIKQQYVVRWLVDSKEVRQTTPQNYGGGYNLSAPTIKEVQAAGATTCSFTDNGNGTCRYRIMTGWDKLPTNIQPTVADAPYDIHATWLERTNVNYTAALADNNYSIEEKLFILKNIASTRSNLAIQDSFPITLGYDGLKPGITILGVPKRYTKTSDMQTTNYMLFDTNKDFTIAIDYKFDYIANSSASEAVLFSCYDDSNGSTQGFKLFYNPSAVSPVPQISFGDTSQPQNIDERVQPVGSNMTDRYMLVIRHTAGTQSNLLYIYSGSNSTGLVNEYDGNLFRKTLKWSSAVSDAKIKLGGVSSTSTSTINAQGTIYSVRYWDEDLGEGECVQLANWCHETMNFALQDYSEHDIHSAILNTSPIKLVLHTLNASQMGTITDAAIDKTTETTVGWDPSTIRTFYNSRIFQALPIKLQSIMSPVSIVHKKAFNSDGGYMIGTGDTSTPEYVFAPSYYETSQVNDSYRNSYTSEAAGSFGWSGITIKQYSNGTFINYTGANSFINLRFPYRNITINNTTTIYLDYPSSNAGLESEISNYGLTLKPGDILIPQNSTVAYIYVSQADTNMGAPRILKTSATPACLDTGSGAWIPSTSWWTRSVSLNAINGTGIQPKHSRFTSIDALGAAQSGAYKTNGIVYSIAL